MDQQPKRGMPLPHLRAWRQHRVMGQTELAAKAGVGRTTVTRAEQTGKVVSYPNVRKLAEALDITAQQLIHEAPPDAKAKGAA